MPLPPTGVTAIDAMPGAGLFFGEGYVLGVPANAAAGAQTITVNYVLTAN